MPPGAPPRSVLAPLGVFVGCLLIYHANGRPHPEVDCVTPPYVAWALLRHGSFDLSRFPDLAPYLGSEVHELPDGRWVSLRPVGAALLAMPVVAPAALVLDRPPAAIWMLHLGKLVAAAAVAAAALLFFLVCRRLAPAAAWPATVLLALGSCLWSVASQALWMHGPATFWICLGLYLLTPWPGGTVASGRIGWAGLALGLAVVTRPTTLFFVLATGLWLLAARRWRGVLALSCGGLGALLLHALANLGAGGHPLLGRYAAEYTRSPGSLWLGVSGLLIAPSRGLLLYSPALLLAPLGLLALLRLPGPASGAWVGTRGLLLAWLGAAGATLLFYGRWYVWSGGWCFGPRFLCETMPIWCLLFALAYAALRAGWQRRLAWGLVAASVLVHLVGVGGHAAHVGWCQRNIIEDDGRSLFGLSDTQIEAHARALLAKVAGARAPTTLVAEQSTLTGTGSAEESEARD
jgi:hypothetical protein